jgi:putative glutamine amidotransferase
MNVGLGGTLFTHIKDQLPNALKHDMPDDLPRTYLAHAVRVEQNTHLFDILHSPTIKVNSLHHQGIQNLAPGLVATAYAPDGLIEGVEIPGHRFAIGVQWHPEWMTSHSVMRGLFRAFIESAAKSL